MPLVYGDGRFSNTGPYGRIPHREAARGNTPIPSKGFPAISGMAGAVSLHGKHPFQCEVAAMPSRPATTNIILHPRPQRCRRRSELLGTRAAYPGAYQSWPYVPQERCHSKQRQIQERADRGKARLIKQTAVVGRQLRYQHPARRSMRRSGTLKAVSLVEPPFFCFGFRKARFAQPSAPSPRGRERLWRIYIPVA